MDINEPLKNAITSYSTHTYESEIGEDGVPTKAFLFKDGAISVINGGSKDLFEEGYCPFPFSYLSTQFALYLTQALASLHANSLISQAEQEVESSSGERPKTLRCNSKEELGVSFDGQVKAPSVFDGGRDPWTYQISKPQIVASNLRIIVENFTLEDVAPRVTSKLRALQTDVATLSQFLQFAAALQTESRLPSVGPICMCDIWVQSDKNIDHMERHDPLVIRMRGGPSLRAPPLRDIAWAWLTLLRPEVLRERYVELCEAYCTSFNNGVEKGKASDYIDEIAVFDVMKDLGENFLHGFLTMVHKFVVSGIWSLDRQLHTRDGVLAFADSISFLVDNGIVGSIFVA